MDSPIYDIWKEFATPEYFEHDEEYYRTWSFYQELVGHWDEIVAAFEKLEVKFEIPPLNEGDGPTFEGSIDAFDFGVIAAEGYIPNPDDPDPDPPFPWPFPHHPDDPVKFGDAILALEHMGLVLTEGSLSNDMLAPLLETELGMGF